jgi:hypothetical protein
MVRVPESKRESNSATLLKLCGMAADGKEMEKGKAACGVASGL